MSRYFLALSPLVLLLLFACQPKSDLVSQRALHQNWEFRSADDDVWRPASVPGVVHTDLIGAGIIEDPFYRSNEDSVQWISTKDWIYKTTFTVSEEEMANKHIQLIFEGLDTHATVKLNHVEVLNANNMFRSWTVDAREHLITGSNTLEIYFLSPETYNKSQAAKLPYSLPEDERVHSRKAPYQFGWDWGPRLITSGVWRPVYLKFWNSANIHDVFLYAQNISEDKADYRAQIEIEADLSEEAEISVSSPDGQFNTQTSKIHLQKGIHPVTLDFTIDEPRLWWPNGMGEAHLYKVDVTLNTSQGILTSSHRLGVRTIELVQEPDAHGSSFEFHINGQPFFAKGANYIPLESFLPRLTASDYEKAIEDAVKANYNMLRVWGGGIYEDKLFYDLCDEKGILVWQDFMFACAMYPGDEPFLENVRQEAIDNVRRIRNHTSIALWCGNNEIQNGWFDWGWQKSLGYSPADSLEVWGHYQKVFHDIIPEVLAAEDPTRQYWPSSPSYGWGHHEATVMGDNHYWGVWWGKEPFEMYRKKVSRFMSEFGFQSFPDWSTVESFSLPEDRDLWSQVMRTHQKHPTGNATIDEYMKRWYPEPKDFESYVYVSQILQSEGMMMGIAAHRQAMPYSMGTLYWQFNDCWPVASWSSRDYYGNWKAMHYTVRKAYDNLFLSPMQEADLFTLFLISDLQENSQAEVVLTLLDFEGKQLSQDKHAVKIKPNSQVVLQAPIRELLKGHATNNSVLKMELWQKGRLLADNLHYFDLPKYLSLRPVDIHAEVHPSEKGYEVSLSADYLAKNVYLSLDDVKGWWSNNYFDLLPGEPVTVTFETSAGIDDFIARLKIISLADAF
jgi:beta-mannosidase